MLPKAELKPTATVTPLKPAPAPVGVNTPSMEHRAAVRTLLDTHFDDSIGAYLDGMDDAKIASKVGVAPAVVERIREAAYGPIRVDPALVALKLELEALRNLCNAAEDRAVSASAEARALRAEVDAMASKVSDRLAGKAA